MINSTNAELLAHHQLPTFRALLAKGRLQYLHHLACEGHPYHWRLLLIEHSFGTGWLREVLEDLKWLQECSELPITEPNWTEPDWTLLCHELRQCPSWKGRVNTAFRKHLLRERIAKMTDDYRMKIVNALEQAQVQCLRSEPDQPPTAPLCHRCPQCDAGFATQRQLATHGWICHGVRAQESLLVQSTVCGGCLKEHWTTARVCQHLRYRPNGCWDRLHGAKTPDEPACIGMPEHLRGFKRVPSVRHHAGPLRPTSQQRLRTRLRQQIVSLRHQGEEHFAWWHPDEHWDLCQPIMEQLTCGAREWINNGPHTIEDYQGTLLDILCSLGLPHDQCSRILIFWIEKCGAADDFAACADPDLCQLGDTAHYALLQDLEIWHLRARMEELTTLLSQLTDEVDYEHQPRQRVLESSIWLILCR